MSSDEMSRETVGYRHTQFGFVTAIGLGSATLAGGYMTALTGHWIAVLVTALMGTLAVVFGTLTMSVRDGLFTCSFGPGLIRRQIALTEITDVSVVRNRWYFGWGIRLTPHGWLWNVSGTRGVEVRFNDGRRFRVGSDEPERLAAAIRGELRTRRDR
jgi:hypothetical protein